MADTKLTALTENTAPALTDLVYLVDDPAGTPASQKVTVQNLIDLAAMVKIAENLLGSDAASVTFSSIPATYRHLKLVGYGRLTQAVTNEYLYARFNGDTGANYDNQKHFATGTGVTSTATYAQTSAPVGNWAGASAPRAGQAGSMEILIPHYAGTAFEKHYIASAAGSYGTSGNNLGAGHLAGFWRSSAAISSIVLFPAANNFKAGSIFSLYGLR